MELEPKLIAAIVAFLGALTMLVKVYTDILRIKADRNSTKEARDKDSQELHDTTQKNTWDIGILRDEMHLLKTQQQDTEHEISIVVKELAVVSTKLDNLIELVKQEHV